MSVNLRGLLDEYLALKAVLGFKLEDEPVLLKDFLDYLEMWDLPRPITAKMAFDWACGPCDRPFPPPNVRSVEFGRRAVSRRLTVIRLFLMHVQASVPDTEVPGKGLVAGERRPKPYILTKDEVARLMDAARRQRPMGWPMRAITYEMLIGLLASCGLRVGEALRLALEDVQLDAMPPRLLIRGTKFHKTRLVPMEPTTALALSSFAERRRTADPRSRSDPFLVYRGDGLRYLAVHNTFERLLRRARIFQSGERRPTLTSLRHTFAVRRLVEWHRQGLDVQEMLPHLSVYMGHVEFANTYWYLSATADLLTGAAESFERYVKDGAAALP